MPSTPVTNHEKALHYTFTSAILKLMIDDDYEIRQNIAKIMPEPKATLLMFEDLLNKLKSGEDPEYKVILEGLEKELTMVSVLIYSSLYWSLFYF